MDFNYVVSNFFASFLIVCRNLVLLIVSPYKTMRSISQEKDIGQVSIILGFVLLYFLVAYVHKPLPYPSFMLFVIFMINFSLTILYFKGISHLLKPIQNIWSLVFTLTYTLIPTLIWFISNATLYSLLPPPRTLSVLGKAFSIFFVSYSISLLVWKLILVYLAIRFSTGQTFLRVIYMIVLYLCVFLPYSVLLYHLKLFRVPFM